MVLAKKNNNIEKRVKNNYENEIQSLNINIKGVKSFGYCQRGGGAFLMLLLPSSPRVFGNFQTFSVAVEHWK